MRESGDSSRYNSQYRSDVGKIANDEWRTDTDPPRSRTRSRTPRIVGVNDVAANIVVTALLYAKMVSYCHYVRVLVMACAAMVTDCCAVTLRRYVHGKMVDIDAIVSLAFLL